jgi:hypothetical protein
MLADRELHALAGGLDRGGELAVLALEFGHLAGAVADDQRRGQLIEVSYWAQPEPWLSAATPSPSFMRPVATRRLREAGCQEPDGIVSAYLSQCPTISCTTTLPTR